MDFSPCNAWITDKFLTCNGYPQGGARGHEAAGALRSCPTSSPGLTFQKRVFNIIHFKEKFQMLSSKVCVVTCDSRSWTGCSCLLWIFPSSLEPGWWIWRMSKAAEKRTGVAFAERDVGPFGATQETALVRFDKSRTDESFCIVYTIFTGLVKTGTLTFMTIK